MSHEEFVAYHRNNHAPLFKSLPEVQQYVKGYVQCHTLPINFLGLPPQAYDGITELWFDSAEDVEKLFTAPAYMETIRPDEAKFLDLQGCGFLLCSENKVI